MRKALTRILCLTALILPSGCFRAAQRVSNCIPDASRADWSATTRDGRVEGKVIDLKEDIPIGNVEVVLDSGAARQRSNATGGFVFDGVPEGRHVLTTNAGAYLPRGDTIMIPVHGGMEGTMFLKLRKFFLKDCVIYKP